MIKHYYVLVHSHATVYLCNNKDISCIANSALLVFNNEADCNSFIAMFNNASNTIAHAERVSSKTAKQIMYYKIKSRTYIEPFSYFNTTALIEEYSKRFYNHIISHYSEKKDTLMRDDVDTLLTRIKPRIR